MRNLAKKCKVCGCSFENWVSGKIMNHIGNHFDEQHKEELNHIE